MKKLISLFMIVVVMFSLVGCKDDKSDELDIKELVYSHEILPCMNEIEGEVSQYVVANDRIYIYSTWWTDAKDAGSGREDSFFYKCNIDGSGLKSLSYDPEITEDQWLHSMEVSPEGDILLLYSGYDVDFMGNQYVIRKLSPDGDVVSEWSLSERMQVEELFIQDMKVDKNGYLYLLSDQTIYILDAEGELLEQLEEESPVTNIIRAKDGDILAGFDLAEGYTLKRIDSEELSFSETYKTQIPYYSIGGFSQGNVYDFYYYLDDGLYGYDLAETTSHKMADWVSSNINSSWIGAYEVLVDNTVLLLYGEAEQYGLYQMKQMDPKDVKIKETVIYASLYPDEEVKKQAISFNKSQDKYQVVVKDYAGSDDPAGQMYKDLKAGGVIDLVDLSGISSDKYAAKGMLADLYTYIDKDKELSKEDFVETALKTMETDGKLYRITPFFGINGMVMDEERLQTGDSLTLSQVEAMEKDGARTFYMESKEGVLSLGLELNYGAYVDWDNWTCHFDGEEFMELLEYADTYPKGEDLVWDENTESLTSMVREEKVLSACSYNMGMAELQLYEIMFGGDIAVTGFPSEKYAGAALSMEREFAICADAKQKEGAWEFLKVFLSEEYLTAQYIAEEYYGVPIRKDCMEERIRRMTATEIYTDSFGNVLAPIDYEWGYEELTLSVGPMSEKQEALYREIIEGIDHRYVYDIDVTTMVQEEAQAYFDGTISAKEAASNIQSRVTTYMEDYK